MWYLIIPLIVGFGIQVGLYQLIRIKLRRVRGASAGMAALGGVSTASMVACCAHHLTDVLPILGLSAAVVFLAKYQVFFMLLGVASNLIGIILMLEIVKKHSLYEKGCVLAYFSGFDLRKVRNATLVLSVVLLFFTGFNASSADSDQILSAGRPESNTPPKANQQNTGETITLPLQTDDLNGVSVEVEPLEVGTRGPTSFKISLNTHSGSLDYDLTKISKLEDDDGNTYTPLSWSGSTTGGHHRSGVLSFPRIKAGVKHIKLTLRDVYGVPERVFEWDIR